MKIHKIYAFKRFFVWFAIFFATMVQGQKIFELMEQDGVNLQEVQEEAERYFNIEGKGKGSGYKLFKRWESNAQLYVQPDGTLLSRETIAQAIRQSKDHKINGNVNRNFNSSNWSELGPLAVTGGQTGTSRGLGRITAIYIEPVEQQLIYVGSPGGGLWKSTNGGNSWNPLGDQFDNMSIWAIKVDPSDTNTVYIGNELGELLKSTDGGENFSVITDRFGVLRDILINPDNPDEIYIALSFEGLLRSTDGGRSWTSLISQGIEDILYKPGTTSTIYACGNNFYRSVDGGGSFEVVARDNGIGSSSRMKIAVSPAEPDYVYIVQKKSTNGFGFLYRSTDSGATFTVRSDSDDGDYVGSQASRDMAIAVSDTDINDVFVAGINVWASADGGSSFTRKTSTNTGSRVFSFVHSDVEVLEYYRGTLYSGSDGGIYKSTDNASTFTDFSAGLGIQQFYKISNSATNKDVVAGGAQDNGLVIKRGSANEWIQYFGADGMEQAVHPTNSDIVYGCHQYGGLKKTSDGGATETLVLNPPETGTGRWITPMTIDPHNGDRVYVGYTNLYRHEDGAERNTSSWIKISSDDTFDTKLNLIEISPANSDVMYATTISTIYKSTNVTSASPTWTSFPSPDGSINEIAIDPYDDNRVALAHSDGAVSLSVDGGANWSNIGGGLPFSSIKSVVFDRSPDRGIYVAIDGAVYYKSDSVTEWTLFDANLPNVNLREVELYYGAEGESRIRVATYGRGLWESPLYDDRDSGGDTTTPPLPPTGLSCSTTIDDYPYAESFESGLGAWDQGTGDDFDWTRQTGGTRSNDTGPSGADDGSFYVYTEVSSPNNPSRRAILSSPCFDLGSTDGPEMNFSYHMFGSQVGTLDLEASTDGSNWTSIWSRSGDQGGEWSSASVDVSDYSASTVKFRFNAVSGPGFRGDIAIDDVSLTSGGTTPPPPPSTFPDPDKLYYIDNPRFDLRVASDGSSNDPYTTSTGTTGADVEWQFVAKGDLWHIQRAAGGTLPRLRSRNREDADMQATSSSGDWTTFEPTTVSGSDTYFLTLPEGPGDFVRLQVNGDGDVKMVPASFSGGWESFAITEVGSARATAVVADIEDAELALESARILVFPNPVATTMNVQLTTQGEEVTLSVVGLSGKTVRESGFRTHKGLNLLKVDTHGLTPGLYIVHISRNGTTVTKKILVE